MKPFEEIVKEYKTLGTPITQYTSEVEHLKDVMFPDEKLLAVAEGGGLGALTNTRLIYVYKGTFSGFDVKHIDLGNINAVTFDSALIGCTVTAIGTSGVILKWVGKKAPLSKFKSDIDQGINNFKNHKPTHSNNVDVISQLERLAELKTKGVLTDEEFAEQKKKILAQG